MANILNSKKDKKPILITYNEKKIGKTVYRLTSKFEGNKKLSETLKRLALKKAKDKMKGA